jgi:hypothetical protein
LKQPIQSNSRVRQRDKSKIREINPKFSFGNLSDFPESMPIWDNLVKGDSEIQGYQTKISQEFSRILDLSAEAYWTEISISQSRIILGIGCAHETLIPDDHSA